MSGDLEENLGIAESPLLSTDAQKRWSEDGAALIAFTLAKEAVVDSPGLELSTSVAISARYRWRLAWTALRIIGAFSRAGHVIADNRNDLLEELLDSSPSHTVIDVEPGSLSNLVQSQSSEQLRQLGGVERVALALRTDTENGINGNDESIAHRRQQFGSNRIQKRPPEVLNIVLETIRDPIILILLLCGVLSLGFGLIKDGWKGWSDGGSIILAVFVVTALTAYCKIWPSKKIFKLSSASDDFATIVIRNGQQHHISVFDVVVGDVISLKLGDQIPADGLYIWGDSLQVDESNMTEATESPKLKDSNDPFLLSGSKVTNGSARMLATAVGMETARATMLSTNCYNAHQTSTPLQMKLHELAMLIAKAGFVSASLVLLVLLIRYFTGDMRDDQGKPHFLAGKTRILHVCKAIIGMLATPFAIASTAIPEGLLLAVTIPQAYSTCRMVAENKALVRSLSAWEKIGSTTVICTNERGNLTTHKLEVSKFWFGHDTFSSIAPNVRELLLHVVVSDCTQVSSAESFTESIELVIQDWALRQMNVDVEQVRANCTIRHQKGDPEVMLAKCSQYYDEHGNTKEITGDVREKLDQMILEMKSKCLQCFAFSCSDVSGDNEDGNENFDPKLAEECLTLLGFVGVTYPCPPKIKEAVFDCQSAEVNIKLVTRSELPAARAIAFQCGILEPNQDTTTGQVVEGLDFQNYQLAFPLS